jgi:hypothetical protein
MHQVADHGLLVALDHAGRLEPPAAVQPRAPQDANGRRGTDAQGDGDLPAVHCCQRSPLAASWIRASVIEGLTCGRLERSASPATPAAR